MLVTLNNSNNLKNVTQPSFFQPTKSKLTFSPEETNLDEVKAYLDLELPKLRLKREKIEDERVIMRTLVNNMEKNKKNWRSDGLGARNIAIDSVKQKVEQQQEGLKKEEEKLKDKILALRRREDKLRIIQQKI